MLLLVGVYSLALVPAQEKGALQCSKLLARQLAAEAELAPLVVEVDSSAATGLSACDSPTTSEADSAEEEFPSSYFQKYLVILFYYIWCQCNGVRHSFRFHPIRIHRRTYRNGAATAPFVPPEKNQVPLGRRLLPAQSFVGPKPA